MSQAGGGGEREEEEGEGGEALPRASESIKGTGGGAQGYSPASPVPQMQTTAGKTTIGNFGKCAPVHLLSITLRPGGNKSLRFDLCGLGHRLWLHQIGAASGGARTHVSRVTPFQGL